MPTTKPDTDTGWSTAKPEHDGYYWWRFDVADPAAPSEIRDGRVYDFQARGSVLLETLDGEWLGPISPSDFEQLLRLREAAEAALLHLQGCGYKTNQQVQEQLIAALREALGHKGGQS